MFVDEALLSFLPEETALLLDAEDDGIPRRSLAVNLVAGTFPREFYLDSSSSLFWEGFGLEITSNYLF